ncbi:Hypothetical protein D9617_4g000670 [Elsinoe fawcettii]|nr:Hypothetical protein D9617_4g000670 [Elsinoe fawcettii]
MVSYHRPAREWCSNTISSTISFPLYGTSFTSGRACLHHAQIANLDSVVVDEVKGRIVGFTTDYIPGGTFDSYPPSVCKFEWVQQLMTVADDLNFKYGVQHRDIHPRNILLDKYFGSIKLIDFNFARRITTDQYDQSRSDSAGVLFSVFELITRNFQHRSEVYDYPDIGVILDLERWPIHSDVELDRPVNDLRCMLRAWIDSRKQRELNMASVRFSHCIPQTPHLPHTPQITRKGVNGHARNGTGTTNGGEVQVLDWGMLKDLNASGEYYVKWGRPTSSKVLPGSLYLATGERIAPGEIFTKG